MLNEKLDKSLRELITQWNIAEQRIKRAEQVRGSEVVASAIFELRYAGRKIIDSLDLALTHDLSAEPEQFDRIHAFIADATEDCVKAKHDAIDAMVSFVTVWFDNLATRATLTKVQTLFPDFLEVQNKIADVQERIAETRKDRNRLRDSIYNSIERGDYEQILSLFDRMKRSHARVAAEIVREDKQRRLMWIATISGILLGVIGVAIGVIGIVGSARHWW
jgi:hypothetical protein